MQAAIRLAALVFSTVLSHALERALDAFAGFACDRLKPRIAGELQCRYRLHGGHVCRALVSAHHHVAGQQDAEIRLDLEPTVRELRVASAEDQIRLQLLTELVAQRGLHVDLREDAEAFLLELGLDTLDRFAEGLVYLATDRKSSLVGHRSEDDGPA